MGKTTKSHYAAYILTTGST